MLIHIWNLAIRGGLICNLRLEFAGNIITRNGYSGYGGGYTFNLTDEERQLLYSACSSSNSLTVRYVVATLINGTETWWSYYDRTMTVVNSNPTFSNCVYEDVGGDSTQLTGNNQILINNFNVLKVTISTANKAVAKNGATMSKYRLVCGNKSVEASYNSNSDVSLILGYVTDRTFIVYAIDSRGNSTNVTKSVAEWKDYSDIVIKTGQAVRTGGVNTETTLSFEGTIWQTEEQYDFGAVENEITECTYKYKKSNANEYIEGETIITPTISNGKFSANLLIKGDEEANGFNVRNSYNIVVTVKDKIKTSTYEILLGSGTPAIAIHRDGASFGAPYDEDEGGSCQVDGSKVVGQDAISAKASRGNLTFTSMWEDVSVGNFSAQKIIGNKLSISDGKVKVGAGVKKVLAFAINDGFYVDTLSGDKCFHLQVNGSNASDGSYYSSQQGSILPLFTSMSIIEVQENDLIGVSVMSGETGTLSILESYLYVQVVE